MFNLWPFFMISYFLGIRIYEINNLGEVMISRRVKIVFIAIFLPTHIAMNIYGFVLFFKANQQKCIPKSSEGDFIYFSVIILSMMRSFMLLMLSVLLIAQRVRIFLVKHFIVPTAKLEWIK
jgi:hypothetical protein